MNQRKSPAVAENGKQGSRKGATMKMEIDTHMHTTASGHAYSSLREMAKEASEKGLKAIGITDHAPDMPGSCHLFHFQNFRVIPKQMYGVRILMGSEVNIRNGLGEVDLPEEMLRKLDLVVASIHPPCYEGDCTMEEITRCYERVMEGKMVDIIGHPDDGRFPVDYQRLARKAKETNTLLELNNSSLKPGGFRLNTRENAGKLLRACMKEQTRIVLGSDAHVDCDVGSFAYAKAVMEEVGFPMELVMNTCAEKMEAFFREKRMEK